MKRGDLVTVAAGSGYGGKPRPAIILQDDRFDGTDSLTLCLCTSDDGSRIIPLLRLPLEPSAANGLREPCFAMMDKVTTVARHKVGRVIGRLEDARLVHLERGILTFLGFDG